MSTDILVKVVFERDLCKMHGFWHHFRIPSDYDLTVPCDCFVSDLAKQIATINKVSLPTCALFMLHFRVQPYQVRFAFAARSSKLIDHIPRIQTPHFDLNNPYLVVLCVAPIHYDVQTLEWRPKSEDDIADDLHGFHDEQSVMLVMKYFCRRTLTIVTLGSYYALLSTVLSRATDTWVMDRLQEYIHAGEVARLPEDGDSWTWHCWEEFSERDLQPRAVQRTLKCEQLWSGDVLIWQVVKKDDAAQDWFLADNMIYLKRAGGQQIINHRRRNSSRKYAHKILADCKFSDFVIVCKDGRVNCHRAFLAAASPVFERMFESGMRECNQQEVNVEELSNVMEAMKAFVYTGEIPSCECAIELLPVADRYGIDDLFAASLEEIVRSASIANIASALRAVRPYLGRAKPDQVWKTLLEMVRMNDDFLEAVGQAV